MIEEWESFFVDLYRGQTSSLPPLFHEVPT